MKVLIAVCSGDLVHADMAMSLSLLVATTAGDPKANTSIAIANPRFNLVQKGRCNAVDTARSMKADKILFIDSDMIFPPHTLTGLLSAQRSIVGCAYYTRREPVLRTARDLKGERLVLPSNGEKTSPENVVEVSRVGTGVLLIDMRVFFAIGRPWFDTPWNGEEHVGEDYSFCDRARKAGFKIWCDLGLSKHIKHIGIKAY